LAVQIPGKEQIVAAQKQHQRIAPRLAELVDVLIPVRDLLRLGLVGQAEGEPQHPVGEYQPVAGLLHAQAEQMTVLLLLASGAQGPACREREHLVEALAVALVLPAQQELLQLRR
jgi:hypothetical protein